MSAKKTNPAIPVGSWAYRNWQAAESGDAEEFAEEIPLYSDARFTGQLSSGLGPYLLLNTVPQPHEPGTLVQALVLRLSGHLSIDTDEIVKAFTSGIPDSESFTGGTAYEELVSLIALAHHVRLAGGAPNRWFHKGDTDVRGTPRVSDSGQPSLQKRRLRPIIPHVCRVVALSTDPLESYPQLEWDSARALARAARSYRQATWNVDADPNLAWLLLVSAAETIANEWARRERVPTLSTAELLQDLKPEFAKRLGEAAADHSEGVLTVVGAELGDVLRAQWKFIQFLLKYGLTPPLPRPLAFPIDWSAEAMKKTLGRVYKCRSEALHASKPFPPPMCEPPFPAEDSQGEPAWGEWPGGASYQDGALWTDEQLPINLHAFHHIVVTAIHNWWKETAAASKTVSVVAQGI